MSEIVLTFPADTANIGLARTVSAVMSARADMPIDQLEDVRLAVDEAVTQAILAAAADATVTCSFDLVGEGLDVRVHVPTGDAEPPTRASFSWMVLSALVDDVEAGVADGELSIRLRVTRSVAVDA